MNLGLSIKHWRFKDIKEHIREAKELLKNCNKEAPNEHGYIYVRRRKNRQLFILLDKLSFFDFHPTNKKRQGAYEHQIALYLHKGWKLFRHNIRCKCGEMEVHHLNGVVDDNNPHNLVYVSPTENKLLANIIGQKNFSLPGGGIRATFHLLILQTMRATYLHLANGCSKLTDALMHSRLALGL